MSTGIRTITSADPFFPPGNVAAFIRVITVLAFRLLIWTFTVSSTASGSDQRAGQCGTGLRMLREIIEIVAVRLCYSWRRSERIRCGCGCRRVGQCGTQLRRLREIIEIISVRLCHSWWRYEIVRCGCRRVGQCGTGLRLLPSIIIIRLFIRLRHPIAALDFTFHLTLRLVAESTMSLVIQHLLASFHLLCHCNKKSQKKFNVTV